MERTVLPFINTTKENGLEAVIRLKGEKRLIFQDAGGLFNRGEGSVSRIFRDDLLTEKVKQILYQKGG